MTPYGVNDYEAEDNMVIGSNIVEDYSEDSWEEKTAPIPYLAFVENSEGLKTDIDTNASPIQAFALLFTFRIMEYIMECSKTYTNPNATPIPVLKYTIVSSVAKSGTGIIVSSQKCSENSLRVILLTCSGRPGSKFLLLIPLTFFCNIFIALSIPIFDSVENNDKK